MIRNQLSRHTASLLRAEIAMVEETIANLRADAHIFSDAESHLDRLKEKLLYLEASKISAGAGVSIEI